MRAIRQMHGTAARCPFHSYHRDGTMRVDGNHGGTLGYEPNSAGQWADQREFAEPQLSWMAPPTTGTIARMTITTHSPGRCSG